MNHSYIQETLKELVSQKECVVLAQIEQLIKDGVLLVEESEAFIFQDQFSNKLQFRQAIKIISKEQEVIDSLKKENAELRERLNSIQGILNVK